MFMVALLLAMLVGCGTSATTTEEDESRCAGAGGSATVVSAAPSAGSSVGGGAELPENWFLPPGDAYLVDQHRWTSEASDLFDFDAHIGYAPNLIDPGALAILVPDALAGDHLAIVAGGTLYFERDEAEVWCTLRAHASAAGPEAPVLIAGVAEFTPSSPDPHGILFGVHLVEHDGPVTVRILGRVSRADRFCGWRGPVDMLVLHQRPIVRP